MHSQVKMVQNFRKRVFWEKQTMKKVPLVFLDVKKLVEM